VKGAMAIDVMSNTLPDGMRNTSVTHRDIQLYYNIQYEHTTYVRHQNDMWYEEMNVPFPA
jgi:hypothetical protein